MWAQGSSAEIDVCIGSDKGIGEGIQLRELIELDREGKASQAGTRMNKKY